MAQSTTTIIDGTRTLTQQETDLNFAEQASFSKITSYKKAQGGKNNEAMLELVPIGQSQPPALHLKVVANGESAGAGNTEVFRSPVFVEGAEKTVLGFRQAAMGGAGGAI